MRLNQGVVFTLLILGLSGCANNYELAENPVSYWSTLGFTLQELDQALSYPSPVKKLWALKSLENKASSSQRLDLLILECFYSLELVPSSQSDRQAFMEAVAKLHSEAMRTSPVNVPDEAVIFLMLGGYNDSSALIDAKLRNTFIGLADPKRFEYRGSVKKQALKSLKKNLAKALDYYVKGDIAASNHALENAVLRNFSLSLDDTEEFMLPEHLKKGAKAPWEIFKWRLKRKTGLRLDAALARLRSKTQGITQAAFQPIQ